MKVRKLWDTPCTSWRRNIWISKYLENYKLIKKLLWFFSLNLHVNYYITLS